MDLPPMTMLVSNNITRASNAQPIPAYKVFILLLLISSGSDRLLTLATTKSPETAKVIPTAERAGPIMENYFTPSMFLNPVNAKI